MAGAHFSASRNGQLRSDRQQLHGPGALKVRLISLITILMPPPPTFRTQRAPAVAHSRPAPQETSASGHEATEGRAYGPSRDAIVSVHGLRS